MTFEALYREHRDAVYGYVAGLLGDRQSAEDVTALAFERAYRKRDSFRPGRGTPRVWLFGIARNAALDELRRRRRQAPLVADLPDESLAHPADDADAAERRTAVSAALRALPPREREIVALKFAGGLTNAELARVLGVSESNAGSLLHRAITKLREACHVAS
ncbi:RNA polymerase sigma factor [Capillimicrobium parvum]|uniref:ECF RNA polymerase sigma factor SigM n=1 Tax=Capillimicrobium parvum TaxID=2884022 RepID=A0A9E7C6X5_9ACTN|nr:sigma-70 family RNA polymerase sigma factor [Capillimicrobium parvum]UGS39179.1 ECF RNA polymerase sigma factor SigM [Capillimicrobium parvum]